MCACGVCLVCARCMYVLCLVYVWCVVFVICLRLSVFGLFGVAVFDCVVVVLDDVWLCLVRLDAVKWCMAVFGCVNSC